MDSDTKLIIGGVAAAGLAYLIFKNPISKTIEGVGEGVSDTIGGVGDASRGIGGGIATISTSTGDAYANVAKATGDMLASNISLLNIKRDVTGIVSAAKNIASNSTRSGSAPYSLNPPSSVSVSKSNTIFTSGSAGKNGVPLSVQTVDTQNAAQMISVFQNAAIKNIATNVGNSTVYTQKAVSLPPSLLSQVIKK